VIDLGGGVFMASLNVVALKVWVALEYLRLGGSAGEHVQDILNANAHAPDARTPSTLVRVKRDSVHLVHGNTLPELGELRKRGQL
jgi:hypothetical protein